MKKLVACRECRSFDNGAIQRVPLYHCTHPSCFKETITKSKKVFEPISGSYTGGKEIKTVRRIANYDTKNSKGTCKDFERC
jgi:hypothetical protein